MAESADLDQHPIAGLARKSWGSPIRLLNSSFHSWESLVIDQRKQPQSAWGVLTLGVGSVLRSWKPSPRPGREWKAWGLTSFITGVPQATWLATQWTAPGKKAHSPGPQSPCSRHEHRTRERAAARSHACSSAGPRQRGCTGGQRPARRGPQPPREPTFLRAASWVAGGDAPVQGLGPSLQSA